MNFKKSDKILEIISNTYLRCLDAGSVVVIRTVVSRDFPGLIVVGGVETEITICVGYKLKGRTRFYTIETVLDTLSHELAHLTHWGHDIGQQLAKLDINRLLLKQIKCKNYQMTWGRYIKEYA